MRLVNHLSTFSWRGKPDRVETALFMIDWTKTHNTCLGKHWGSLPFTADLRAAFVTPWVKVTIGAQVVEASKDQQKKDIWPRAYREIWNADICLTKSDPVLLLISQLCVIKCIRYKITGFLKQNSPFCHVSLAGGWPVCLREWFVLG